MLREGHSGERHQSNEQHKANGFHVLSPQISVLSAPKLSLMWSRMRSLRMRFTVVVNYNNKFVSRGFYTFFARRPHPAGIERQSSPACTNRRISLDESSNLPAGGP